MCWKYHILVHLQKTRKSEMLSGFPCAGNATFLVHLQKTRKCEMLSGFPCAGNATSIDTFTEDQEI